MRVVKAVKQDLCPDCGHWHDHTGRPLVAVIDSQGTEWRIPKGHMPRNNTDDLGGRLYHSDCRNDGILEPARASTEGREDDTRRWTLEGDDESGRAGHITVHGEPLGPGERVRVYERPTEGEETSSGTSDLPANTEGRAVEGGASPSGPSLAEQLRQESLRADAFFRGREVAQARAEREKARADRAEAELARARSDVDADIVWEELEALSIECRIAADMRRVAPWKSPEDERRWFTELADRLDRIRERLQGEGTVERTQTEGRGLKGEPESAD
jgi:hypothetical protein